MRLSELRSRQMAIIYVLALLISGSLLYKFVALPELTRYLAAVTRYNSQQQQEMRQVSRRDALVDEYLALKEKADKTQKLLFTEREAEDFFLRKLPELSARTGNKLTSMTPKDSHSLMPETPEDRKQEDEPSPPGAEVSQKPVPITITGEYGDIIELFSALEEDKKLMAISNVGVSSAPSSQSEVAVSFSLNLIHAGSDIDVPPGDILADIVAISKSPAAPSAAVHVAEQAETARETTATVSNGTAKPSRFRWFSSILSRLRRRQDDPERPDRPQQLEVELADKAAELRPGLPEDRAEPVKEVTKRFSVQVGVFDVESNVKELVGLLQSKGHKPWVKPGLMSETPPYSVFVGKFGTEREADGFGRMLLRELSWANEYMVKEILLDYDTVLREVH